MARLSDLAAMFESNNAVYREMAKTSLALSKIADVEIAKLGRHAAALADMNKIIDPFIFSVGEQMQKMSAAQTLALSRAADLGILDAGNRIAAITDINKMIDPSIFSVGERLQETFASSYVATVDSQITEIARRAIEAADVTSWQRQFALDVSRGAFAQFEASIGANLRHLNDIPRRLGVDILASLDAFNQRQWAMLQAAVLPRMDNMLAGATSDSFDEFMIDDFVETEAEAAENGGRSAAPLVLTRYQVLVIAYIMTMLILVFSLGEEGLTRERLREDLHMFALGVLGGLTILLLKPPDKS